MSTFDLGDGRTWEKVLLCRSTDDGSPLWSITSLWPSADYFRSSPVNGRRQGQCACLKSANNRHQPGWASHSIRRTIGSRLDCGTMVQERPVQVERRLSAILAADVAGYSRLMHHDEEATHAKLTALLADGVTPAISEHGGRIVKNTGDGFLAEFPSAVQAVRAAVQFQTRIKALTTAEAEDRRIAFRVGINVGDVMVEPHDIFGDGVNIAARLESIAEPGGICIAAAAYDQVRGKVDVQFADLGEQNL